MNESIAQTVVPKRLVLLVKSQKFSGRAGYYLSQGRWHAVSHDKPAPKDVPVVRSMPENGEASMTAEMWGKVYAHPDNTNKGVFVKKLDKLKAAYEAGDAHAILAGSYPNDTTNKKVVKIANYLLHLLGSEHKVEPGLKAGTHAALSAATADHHEQANQAAQQASDQAVVAAAAPEPIPSGELKSFVVSQFGKNAEMIDGFAYLAGRNLKNGRPIFVVDGNVNKTVFKKMMEEAKSAGIEASEKQYVYCQTATYTGPNMTITQLSEIAYSKLLPESVAVPDPAPGDLPPPEPAPIANEAAVTSLALPAFVEGKTTKGVVEYYAGVANTILDMAAASDVDGLAKLKHYGEKPNSKGKISNTWAGKTANSKMLIALHAEAMASAGGNKPIEVPEPSAEAPIVRAEKKGYDKYGIFDSLIADIDAAVSGGDATTLKDIESYLKTPGIKSEPGLDAIKQYLDKAKASATLPPAAAPAAAEPAPPSIMDQFNSAVLNAGSASQASKEAFAYLHANGTTPETVGHAVDILTAHGFTDLAAGFQGAKDKAAEISAAKAAMPTAPADLSGHFALADLVGEALKSGDKAAIADVIEQSDLAPPDTNLGKVHAYATAAWAYLNQGVPVRAPKDVGPKEGDTKEGADGMLVLKDGHWVKVEADAPAPEAAAPAGLDA
ncbi:hypothetical protein, partial [Pseudomonas sp.]|uniref:hypothetical protein n=1 Tax=Pseudomonas sp. TaxID=306 RepID=UPI003FD7C8CA